MTFEEIKDLDDTYVMRTYGRFPVAFVRGEGARLWDVAGKEYLDFLSGISVASVGHCHPDVVAAIRDQAGRLLHVSNLFYTEPQPKLARRLHDLVGWGRVFFANSGAEANECAIKLARRHAGKRGEDDRVEVVSALGSFHGRTLATLAATGQTAKHAAFAPLPPELLHHVPFNDVAALDAAVGKRTSAVLLEVVQGEGGINPADREYLQAARDLCDERGALLVFDEVQTGIGRTGRWFGFQHFGVVPDVMTLAKALGGGLPIGACLAREEVAESFAPGDHASTFGGGPVPCAASLAVIDVVERFSLVANAEAMGHVLRTSLAEAVAGNEAVTGVRGLGLLVGVQLAAEQSRKVVDLALERGLVLNNVTPSTVRLAPPLVIGRAEIESAVRTLAGVLKEIA